MSQRHKSTFAITVRVIIAAMGNIYFGYSLGYYGITQVTIVYILGYQDSQNKAQLDGLINSLLAIGGAFGAFASSKIVQKYGIRKTFLICDCCGILIAINSLYLDWWSITSMRFLFGVIVGINSAIDPQYINQVTPISLSGVLGVICNTFILLGLTIAFGLTWIFIVNDPMSYIPLKSYGILGFNSWRILFAFPAAICLIRLIAFGFLYTQDLPSELLRKGDRTKSKSALMEIYKDEYVDEILEELEEDLQLQGTKVITLLELMGRGYRKRMIVGSVLSLLNQWSGINAISFYALIIFNDITKNNLFWNNALSVMCQLVGMSVSIASGSVINKFGRRILFLIGNGICFITLSALTILYFILQEQKNTLTDQQFNMLQIIIVVCIFTFIMAYSMSLGPVFWVYLSEILPSQGIGIVLVQNWISLALLTQFFPIISEKAGVVVCFGLFAIVTFLGEFIIFFEVRETKKLTKTQIHNIFTDDSVDGETNDIKQPLKSVNEGDGSFSD